MQSGPHALMKTRMVRNKIRATPTNVPHELGTSVSVLKREIYLIMTTEVGSTNIPFYR